MLPTTRLLCMTVPNMLAKQLRLRVVSEDIGLIVKLSHCRLALCISQFRTFRYDCYKRLQVLSDLT